MIPLLMLPKIIKKLIEKYPDKRNSLYKLIFYFFLALKIGIIFMQV